MSKVKEMYYNGGSQQSFIWHLICAFIYAPIEGEDVLFGVESPEKMFCCISGKRGMSSEKYNMLKTKLEKLKDEYHNAVKERQVEIMVSIKQHISYWKIDPGENVMETRNLYGSTESRKVISQRTLAELQELADEINGNDNPNEPATFSIEDYLKEEGKLLDITI